MRSATGRHGNPRRRLATTWLVAVLAAGALSVRVADLQLSPSAKLIESGERQRFKSIPLQATRGSILDRNGAELAISVPQTTIAADARAVVDPVGDAAKLAPILGRDQQELQVALSTKKSFVYLKRQADDATAEAVAALDLSYVQMYTEPKRFLPAGDRLGLSVVGRTDIDQNGQSGLEKQYDDVLSGDPGSMIIEMGAGGRTIPGGEQEIEPATTGSDLVVSLDRGLQYEVEQMLMRAVDEREAKGGTVLVMRTETGEILANANVERPVIDPAAPDGTAASTGTPDDKGTDGHAGDEGTASEGDAALPEAAYGPAQPVGQNRAVTWTYEPGSVNKVITMAAVLEEELATPDQRRVVTSSLQVWDYKFNQEGRSDDADLSLREILARSDNLGTIAWATDLGEERLDGYLRRFGLGEKSPLDFPNEAPGSVRPVDDWSPTSLPTFAIGQGLTVTPMQMLGVYNTIANDGLAVAPRLVLGTEDPDGGFTPHEAPAPQQVVSEDTATALRDMLAAVVREGTGQKAQVDGFSVGGKTGTAWKAQSGGYGVPGARQLVTTFAGFLPAGDPELTILVVLDEPANPNSTGGNAAAPLFKQVATYAVHHLRLPPDAPADPVAGETDRVRAEPQPVSLAVVPPAVAGATTTTTSAAPR